MNAYPLTLDGKPPVARIEKKPRPWRRFLLKHLTNLSILLMVLLLVGIVLFPYTVMNVPTGHVGVVWKRFRGGTVLDPRLLKNEGMRVIWPWDKLFVYDLRLQSTNDTYNAISKDGVSLTASINIRFRLKHDAVPQLHQSIGPNYVATLVRPEIGSRMREVIAEYTAEEVYSTKRQEIQDRIRGRTEAMLGEKMMERGESEDYAPYRIPLYAMINLIDTLILGMELPAAIVHAINRKIEQYYISEEYTFRIEREKKESERKRIEGEGIRSFQQIVSQGISDSYLRWRGIEATLQLAQSNNSKIVIIGSGKEGLPIILGNVDAPPAPPAATPPAGNGGAATKDKPTAASPAAASEQVPAAAPASGTPASPPEKASAPEKKSSTTPDATQPAFPFPLSLSDIEAFFSRLSGTAPRATTPEAGAGR